MVRKGGFSFIMRSSGEIPSGSTQVVGDTMGELMLLYGIADMAFVGGSWSSAAVITRWSRRHMPFLC
jgi:3-deoxy-D-manno-octulosonic-acid transferase